MNVMQLCVVPVLYLWVSVHQRAFCPGAIQSRQRLQDIEGNKSNLVKAIPTLPPTLRWLNYLRQDTHKSCRSCDKEEYAYCYGRVNSSKTNYGCVPQVFLLVAQRVHCCFEPQNHNCSSTVSHPLGGEYFLLWNRNILSNICNYMSDKNGVKC